jgi:hypothetical protein
VAARADGDAPARARLFLRHVQLFFGADLKVAVGYGPNAGLKLPRDYGLDEAGRADGCLHRRGRRPACAAHRPGGQLARAGGGGARRSRGRSRRGAAAAGRRKALPPRAAGGGDDG